MRVLVADDDPIARLLLTKTLENGGYDVVAVAEGDEAWRVLSTVDAPPIALLDCMMPGQSGVDLCRRVRAEGRSPQVYVILATGFAREADSVRGLDSGADDFVRKPFDLPELLARIRVGERFVRAQADLLNAQEELRREAEQDELTGLSSRRQIARTLLLEISRSQREATNLGIVLADVDHFKRINDTLGRPAGDQVLREVAQRLRSALRPYDGAGRFGGEEFLLVLPGCDSVGIRAVGERVLGEVSKRPIEVGAKSLTVTISAGLASFRACAGASPEALLRAADEALYRSKAGGRNRALMARSSGELPAVNSKAPPRSLRAPAPQVSVRTRILVVDDNIAQLRLHAQLLRSFDCDVELAAGLAEAATLLSQRSFGAVVSDVRLGDASGLDLLRLVRNRDLDVPVLLLSADPRPEDAEAATAYGAHAYLARPVDAERFRSVVQNALHFHDLAKIKRRMLEVSHTPDGTTAGDRAGLEAVFERARHGLWIALQPIVSPTKRSIFGYEVFVRSDEPNLQSPAALLHAAEALGELRDLGRTIRKLAAEAAASIGDACLFVNLQPRDLLDEELYSEKAPLSRLASRVVLALTEKASLDQISELPQRAERLRKMGFRFAVDDLGTGSAGLGSIVQIQPEIAKIDRSMIRAVDQQPKKLALLENLVRVCRALDMMIIASGVETKGERDALAGAGCELAQGDLFARPGRSLHAIDWVA